MCCKGRFSENLNIDQNWQYLSVTCVVIVLTFSCTFHFTFIYSVSHCKMSYWLVLCWRRNVSLRDCITPAPVYNIYHYRITFFLTFDFSYQIRINVFLKNNVCINVLNPEWHGVFVVGISSLQFGNLDSSVSENKQYAVHFTWSHDGSQFLCIYI